MLRTGTQDSYIRNRINMPTARSHAELAQMDPKIRAQAFFSARVAEAHILDRLREVSDRYSRGEIGLGEARNTLKDFLKAEGYDPHKAGLKNLASTARLNLVMRQNAAMANAAAEWKRMHDPDAMKIFPYVRYHARQDSRSRDGHKELDGKIFHKDDPFLKTHTPPWEFNCRCWLEEITAKEAGGEPEKVQEPTPPEDVTIDSASGFSFDPEHAFEEHKLPNISVKSRREMLASIRKQVDKTKTTFAAAPSNIKQESPLVSNLPPDTDIENFIAANKPILDNPAIKRDNKEMRKVPESLDMGSFSREVIEAFALEPGEDRIVLSRGNKQFGLFHQIGEHEAELLDGRMIQAIRETLGNKKVKYTLCMQPGKNNYINIEALDGSGYLTLIRKGVDGHWEIVSAHCRASTAYKNRFNRT